MRILVKSDFFFSPWRGKPLLQNLPCFEACIISLFKTVVFSSLLFTHAFHAYFKFSMSRAAHICSFTTLKTFCTTSGFLLYKDAVRVIYLPKMKEKNDRLSLNQSFFCFGKRHQLTQYICFKKDGGPSKTGTTLRNAHFSFILLISSRTTMKMYLSRLQNFSRLLLRSRLTYDSLLYLNRFIYKVLCSEIASQSIVSYKGFDKNSLIRLC